MIEVRRSGIHGLGVFASRHIDEGEVIGVYEGRRYTAKQSAGKDWDQALTYLFAFSDGSVIDGSEGGNATRHLNHSCKPNCVAFEERRSRRKVIVIYALRRINAARELFLDYRLDVSMSETREFRCLCATSRCRGTMAMAA